MTKKAVCVLVLCVAALPVRAGSIEMACLHSDRAAGNRSLCGCIQDAADLVLSGRDQRLVSGFISDPSRADKMRQSPGHAAQMFWKRYLQYIETARAFCG